LNKYRIPWAQAEKPALVRFAIILVLETLE